MFLKTILVYTVFALLCFVRANKDAYEMLKAAERGETDRVIQLIKDHGVFITTKNNYGVSAIIFAANGGNLELVERLIDLGANIDDRANNWRTPLLCASLWGHTAVVKYLVERGANVSVYDHDGMTTVMSATINGHTHIVKYLLDHGANPLAKNFVNGTALSIARVKGHQEIVTLLEPHFLAVSSESPFVIALELAHQQLIATIDMLIAQTSRLMQFYRPIVESALRSTVEAVSRSRRSAARSTVSKDTTTSKPIGTETITSPEL